MASLILVILVTLVMPMTLLTVKVSARLPAAPAAAAAQPRTPAVQPTEARVRALVQQAQREARGDATELVLALDRRIRETWGDFESFPVSIVRRDDLLVTLSTPVMAFRRSVVDVLRTQRPVTQASWQPAAVLSIGPARLGAPDITTVTLTRDGQAVAPLRSALRPMTFADGNGQQSVLHAGDIHFPMAALAPDARVVLTLQPREGGAIEYVFDNDLLRTLK